MLVSLSSPYVHDARSQEPKNVGVLEVHLHLFLPSVPDTRHAVGLYRVPGHAGVRGNEIADMLAVDGSAIKFVRAEPALGDSRQDIRRRIRRWLVNQHWVRWRGLGDTQRQAQELISGPCLVAKTSFLKRFIAQKISEISFFPFFFPFFLLPKKSYEMEPTRKKKTR